jgi:hypothetical protein
MRLLWFTFEAVFHGDDTDTEHCTVLIQYAGVLTYIFTELFLPSAVGRGPSPRENKLAGGIRFSRNI